MHWQKQQLTVVRVVEKKKGPGGAWGVPETAINFCNEQKWFFNFIILQIEYYIVVIYLIEYDKSSVKT